MALKLKLNEALGSQLKEFRNQYKVKAKDVADELGKSPAYISKLEKGQIKQIDRSEFEKIANFITKSEEGYYLFFEQYAEKVDIRDLERDLVLLNFDLVDRKIPVPECLVTEISKMMREANLSVDELTSYINQNEDLENEFLSDVEINPDTVEKNVWHCCTVANDLKQARPYIYLEYSSKRINDLIDGKIKKCEYMFLYAITHHLLKAKYKNEGIEYNDQLADRCQKEAEEVLLNNKFYSLAVKNRFRKQSETEEEYKKLLSKADIDNSRYVIDMIQEIGFLSEYDVEYTNEKLKTIVSNMKDNDASFALAFMATSLEKLKDVQITLKKEFLKEVCDLVEKYSIKAETHTGIEKY